MDLAWVFVCGIMFAFALIGETFSFFSCCSGDSLAADDTLFSSALELRTEGIHCDFGSWSAAPRSALKNGWFRLHSAADSFPASVLLFGTFDHAITDKDASKLQRCEPAPIIWRRSLRWLSQQIVHRDVAHALGGSGQRAGRVRARARRVWEPPFGHDAARHR
jgi:hypothetical protein